MTRLVLVAAAVAAIGCDTFFEIRGRVVACETHKPVIGARVLAHLDRGYGEPDVDVMSGADGSFSIWMNEPSSAYVIMRVEAEGFNPWKVQYQGVPTSPKIEICLRESPSQ